MNKNWIFPTQLDFDQVEKLARQLNISALTAGILIRRGFKNVEEIETFFSPKGLRLGHYEQLPGTVEAGHLLADAINHQQVIAIFGDYDVDGITSSALLAEFITARKGKIHVHLPDRYKEGYGLNRSFIDKALAIKAAMLITVDCGTSAIEEIAYAKSKGLKVIVTDHHEPAAVLPQADVLVNPKVAGPPAFRILAGVGVALQVIRAAAAALGEKDPEQLRKHLDLVALGTIADVVPLTGENRLLTKAGLAVINRGGRLGLKALLTSTGMGVEPLRATDLAFRIAPRLNAAGRMGQAKRSYDLLTAHDAVLADELARELNHENCQRQLLQKRVLAEAEAQLDVEQLPKVLLVAGEDWPHGVVGLVASRLCEKYYRPCLALSIEGDQLKGSGRSIKGFSLHQALEHCSAFLEKWGGHDMAAGVTLQKENLSIFNKTINKLADTMLEDQSLIPELLIDGEADLALMTHQLLQEFKRFEPIGFGNGLPLLVVKGLVMTGVPRVVGEQHLKFTVRDDQHHTIDVIGFGHGYRLPELTGGQAIDVAGYVNENKWNGTSSIQFELKDFRVYD